MPEICEGMLWNQQQWDTLIDTVTFIHHYHHHLIHQPFVIAVPNWYHHHQIKGVDRIGIHSLKWSKNSTGNTTRQPVNQYN
jgi:hypothetical protein